ncbi:MC123R [Molluscum contagiosum virus]|uniref:MC123R n=1 Tax=Molluscum contagiosum virus TaxID=10279 RepID=A0A858A4H7_9POXV|nr:MC123R [Molluscum contagiosum virus]
MSGFLAMDDKLYADLKKLVGAQPLYLFTARGDFVEVARRSEFCFRVPAGFFAGEGVPLRGQQFPAGSARMPDAAHLRLPRLYPAQQQVVAELRAIAKACAREQRPLYVTLHLACGFGKTVTASYLLGTHRRRAVVCVPTKVLLAQWGAALAALRVSVYVSGEGVRKLMAVLRTRDFSVLVVVNKHFADPGFCALVHERYDVFVLDESHTYNLMNLTLMTRFLSFFPPRICYFLSATPRAANRVYCNRVVNVTKFSALRKTVRVLSIFFPPFSNARIREFVQRLDSVHNKYHIYTEKALAEDAPRNASIVAATAAAFERLDAKRVLLITKLRSHMLGMHAALSARLGAQHVFLGDAQSRYTPEIVRELRASERFVFVSTLFYSGTGLDIPHLDTLVVCHAVMNHMQAEQLLGRICRETEQPRRTVYVFPTTSVREIKNMVGLFAQRFITLATQKLGFTQEREQPEDAPEKHASAAAPADKRVPTDRPASADKRVPTDRPASADKRVPTDRPASADKRVPTDRPASADKRVPTDRPASADKRVPVRGQASAHRQARVRGQASAHRQARVRGQASAHRQARVRGQASARKHARACVPARADKRPPLLEQIRVRRQQQEASALNCAGVKRRKQRSQARAQTRARARSASLLEVRAQARARASVRTRSGDTVPIRTPRSATCRARAWPCAAGWPAACSHRRRRQGATGRRSTWYTSPRAAPPRWSAACACAAVAWPRTRPFRCGEIALRKRLRTRRAGAQRPRPSRSSRAGCSLPRLGAHTAAVRPSRPRVAAPVPRTACTRRCIACHSRTRIARGAVAAVLRTRRAPRAASLQSQARAC